MQQACMHPQEFETRVSCLSTCVHGVHGRVRKEADLSYIKNEHVVKQRVPGLIYADVLLLMADNRIGMQGWMYICCEEATSEKSAIMVFNDDMKHKAVSPQELEIQRVDMYKYLGEWLNECEGETHLHKAHLKRKGRRNGVILKRKALWGYNIY